jgi:hypothetical protein
MSDDVSQIVDQLLREREKYEAWLKRLETERSAATGRVVDRVHADYQQRLDEVTEQLRVHSEGVRSKLSEMEHWIKDLEGEMTARSEELDEARLRRSVGEYRDDNEWSNVESRLEGSVSQMQSKLESARAEIDRLREIVALVQSAEQRLAAPAPTPQPATPAPPPAAPPSAPQPAAAGAPEGEEGFLSLEELVLQDKEPSELGIGLEPPAPAPGPAHEPAAPEGGVGDELAFLESLSLSGGDDQQEQSFSFLEQHGSGTPQTILCPHCSAANDPAEWYCTECGEELPAE